MANTFWLRYRLDGMLCAEPFGSRLAALGRAMAVSEKGAADIVIEDEMGADVPSGEEIALLPKGSGAVTKH